MAMESVPPMYMPGRRRTGSRPSSTSIEAALYSASPIEPEWPGRALLGGDLRRSAVAPPKRSSVMFASGG